MIPKSPRRTELQAFLKSRRAALSPERAGLSGGGRRRAPGLRREELAALAGVSATWYTWLEQGREVTPSAELLARLSRALQLNDADEEYLYSVTGQPRPSRRAPPFVLDSGMAALLETYPSPVFMVDGVGELLARNTLADRLFGKRIDAVKHSGGEFADNEVWDIFMNPLRRALYRDYERFARGATALFRSMVAQRFADTRVQALISALLAESPLFTRLWSEHETNLAQPMRIGMTHPDFGDMQVHSVRFPYVGPHDAVVIFLVPADECTRLAFARCAPAAQS